MLDQITKINRGQHTREIIKGAGTYATVALNEQITLDNIVSKEVALLRTEIELLTKQFTFMGVKNVNVVGA